MICKILKLVGDIKGKNILFLQGPVGPFFNYISRFFVKNDAKIFTIGFNFGDYFYANKSTYTPYKDIQENWGEFFVNFINTNKIDMLFLFGDCRFYHKVAIKIAKENGLDIFVFEEGYLRPSFITLQKNGVNANSNIIKDGKFYKNFIIDAELESEIHSIKEIKGAYKFMALHASIYYNLGNIFSFKYPNYKHHRDFNAFKEGVCGVRNFIKKYYLKIKERNNIKKLISISKKYYFVPLQVHNDFQVTHHSKYKNIEEFISEVLISFAKNASKKSFLVFKHHPMDRGKKDYTKFIVSLAKKLNVESRILITFDTNLPTALKNAKATITINSTVGFQSLYHKTPVLCLGNALYDIEGLTSKGVSLTKFWKNYKKVDAELFFKFKNYLLKYTQINGSFYKIYN